MDVTNVPEGYRATISELDENITIEVRGLSLDVSGIAAANIRGSVDIEKWMQEQGMEEPVEGFYQVEVDFGLPDNVTIREPVTVMMHLSKVED